MKRLWEKQSRLFSAVCIAEVNGRKSIWAAGGQGTMEAAWF